MTYIKILTILGLCYFRSILLGSAKNNAINPKKILVVQMAQLGDMVCTTPVFRAIKNKYPNCHVAVLGKNKLNGELLMNNNDVDIYISHKSFSKIFGAIRKGGFDASFIVVPNFWALAATYLAGVPCIVATELKKDSSPNQTRSYSLLLRLVNRSPLFYGQYFPKQYLNVLKYIGIESNDTKKYLGFSEKAKFFADSLLKVHLSQGRLVAGISPSAGNKIKIWPAGEFAKLADYLYEKYNALIVIIGAESDQEEADKMLSYVNKKTEVLNTTAKINIDQLKALVSKLSIFISVDTGPIYIAESFDVPTIDITGPIDETEQPPINTKHRVVVPINRIKPEMHVMNARNYNYKEARRQVESISAEMVIKEFNDLIKYINT